MFERKIAQQNDAGRQRCSGSQRKCHGIEAQRSEQARTTPQPRAAFTGAILRT